MVDKLQEEFLATAREYSDTRIMNTVNQPFNFSKEKLAAAKTVAIERNLISKDGVVDKLDYNDLVKQAKIMFEQRRSMEHVLKTLKSRGSVDEEIASAIHEAALKADLNNYLAQQQPTKYNVWKVFLLLYIALRITGVIFN